MRDTMTDILASSPRWGVNSQPSLEEMAAFLEDVARTVGLQEVRVIRDDTLYFRTEKPLPPQLAYRLGRMMWDGEPDSIEPHQTEFTLWWD